MRWGALCVIGIAAAIASGGREASAQTPAIDDPIGQGLSGGTKPEPFLLFSGFDIWRNGYAGYAGLQWKPDASDGGFLLRLFASGGVEQYRDGSRVFKTEIVRAALLPGWQFRRGNFEINIFAGPDLENDTIRPDNFAAKLRGTHFGARVATDLWWEPNPAMMLASSLSATTIGSGFSARGAAGWRLLDRFWIGPEISASGDEFSRQYRAGAHLTGFKTANVEWSLATGYVRDSFDRSGIYGRIGASIRR